MKYFCLFGLMFLTSCATRHVPDTTTWFADCYNKQRQEAFIARAETRLSDDDYEARKSLRRMYWQLQKECK